MAVNRMHICVVAEGYPGINDSAFVFVQQLCDALADNGVRVSVIAPQSITRAIFRRRALDQKVSESFTKYENKVKIYRPYIVTIGDVSGVLKIMVDKFTAFIIAKVLRRMSEMPNICYGHFWHTAYALYPAAKKNKIPLILASGESEIQLHRRYHTEKLRDFIDYVSGIIFVSTEKKVESVKFGLSKGENGIVLPNGVDLEKFHPKDKEKIRKKFGLSHNDFVVISVGNFDQRKGSKRISDAISLLDDENVKSIFIGDLIQDGCDPECNGIVFKGRLMHDEVVDYLNCADVFLLPTLKEGSCNAILEAMACGLPIISSDLEFNYDILNASYALFVDPLNVSEISSAILFLKNNPEIRTQMGEAALSSSKEYDIYKRAAKIINYIDLCLMGRK